MTLLRQLFSKQIGRSHTVIWCSTRRTPLLHMLAKAYGPESVGQLIRHRHLPRPVICLIQGYCKGARRLQGCSIGMNLRAFDDPDLQYPSLIELLQGISEGIPNGLL